MPDEMKQDRCSTCGETVAYAHDAWWHAAEIFGTYEDICQNPQPRSWATERALA